MQTMPFQFKGVRYSERFVGCVVLSLGIVGCLDLPEPIDPAVASSPAVDALDVDITLANSVDVSMSGDADSSEADPGVNIAQDGGTDTDADADADLAVGVDAATRVVDAEVPCGNGVVDVGEECDEGGPTSRCSVDCTEIVCGNGRVDQGEVCDDGNQDDTDGCIDNCSAFFPDTWGVLAESEDVGLASAAILYCDGAPPEGQSLMPRREVVHGRQSLRMWTHESEVWIPFGTTLSRPTRLTINVFVPDGFKRKFRMVLATNEPQCGAEIGGPFIKHKDRKEEGNPPLVEVSVGIRPQEFSYFSIESGVPDQWVALSMVVLPETGHVRFWYGGRYITQVRRPEGVSPGYLRLIAEYERGAGVGDSISVSGLRVEEAQP